MTTQLANLQSSHFHAPLWLKVILMSLAVSPPILLMGTAIVTLEKDGEGYDAIGLSWPHSEVLVAEKRLFN